MITVSIQISEYDGRMVSQSWRSVRAESMLRTRAPGMALAIAVTEARRRRPLRVALAGREWERMQKRVACVSMGAESEIHGRDGAGRKGGGGIIEGAVSRGARDADFLSWLETGSGAAGVDEQSGPGSGREATGADCLRRDGAGGEELGMLPRHRKVAARAGGGRDAAGAIRQAGGNFSYA